MANWGALAGGAAAGLAEGFQIGQNQQKIDIQRELKKQQQQAQRAKLDQQLGELFAKALSIEDENLRPAALDNFAKYYEQTTGKPYDKSALNYFKKAPEEANDAWSEAQSKGMSFGQFISSSNSPLMFIAGAVAHDQRMSRKRAVTALSATDNPDLPQPGEDTATQAKRLEIRIKALERAEREALTADPTLKGPDLAGLRDQAKQLRDMHAKLVGETAVKDREQAEQPVPANEIEAAQKQLQRAGHSDLAFRIRPGIKRRLFDSVMELAGPQRTEGVTQPQTPPQGSPRGFGPGIVAPSRTGSPRAPVGPVETPAEAAELKRRTGALDNDLLRDPAVAKAGLKTVGELEDRLAADPTFRLTDKAALERLVSAQRQEAETAFKDLTTIRTRSETARERKAAYTIIAAVAERSGPTGPWITPIREQVNKLAQVIGVSNPRGMSEIELGHAMSTRLAVSGLKDVGGNDTEKELQKLMLSNPNLFASSKGLYILIRVGSHLEDLKIQQGLQAERWKNFYGDLNRPNNNGESFQEVFQRDVLDKYPVYGVAAEALGIKASELTPRNLQAKFREAFGAR